MLDIMVDDHEVTVETLGPRLARVVDPGLTLKVSENDIIRLSHDPGEAEGTPHMVEILHRINPVLSEIEFWTGANRNRMIALAAVLGAEVVNIKEGSDVLDFPGIVRIAHPVDLDIAAIAEAAGVTEFPTDDIDEDEQDEAEGKAESVGVLDFDQYFKKPVYIPLFIWDDGDMRPFQGLCRGNGPISDQEEWEETIGVFTAEGKYFSVLIDTRVRCALPQFFIDKKPFHFPIVSFATMGPWVDPETGILKAPPNAGQGQGVAVSKDQASAETDGGAPAVPTIEGNSTDAKDGTP